MFFGRESGDDLDGNLRPELVHLDSSHFITLRIAQRIEDIAFRGDIYLLASFDILGQLHLTHAPRTDGLPERPLARWRGDGRATPRLGRRGLGGLSAGRMLGRIRSAVGRSGGSSVYALSFVS